MVERKKPVWPWLASLALHFTVLPLLLGAWWGSPDLGRPASVPTQTPLTVRLSAGQGQRSGPSDGGERHGPSDAGKRRRTSEAGKRHGTSEAGKRQGGSSGARERAQKREPAMAVRRPQPPAPPKAPAPPGPQPAAPPNAPANAPPRPSAAAKAPATTTPRLPEPQAMGAPDSPYPQAVGTPDSPYPQAPARSSNREAHGQQQNQTADAGQGSPGTGGQPLVWLEAPVLLKGPREIPVPDFLQKRPGHFKLALRCAIGADASSQVSVMDSSGVVALDESVRESFTGLRWYPGERNGVPVALTVRLIIEGSWAAGDRAVDWGFRVPPAHF